MLPTIKNYDNQSYLRASQPKVYNPIFQSAKDQSDKKSFTSFSHSANKIFSRVAVRKQQPSESPHKPSQNFKQGPIFVNSNLKKYRNMPEMAQQIREIEKKIRQCQKRLQYQRKKQQQIMETGQSQQYDFQKVIQRELQMQQQNARNNQENAGFDYLTNPGKNGKEQEQQIVQQLLQPPKQVAKSYNIAENIQKLQKHYENNLKKKFERRQMFPHQPCRRKTPKLFITQKNNALKKNGRVSSDQQHLFRVFTKQTTPQQIYPTIPNFAVVKDNLSKNIVAYLGDYKPFLQKTKQSKGIINVDTTEDKKSQEQSKRVDDQQQFSNLKIDQKNSQEPIQQIINISNQQ